MKIESRLNEMLGEDAKAPIHLPGTTPVEALIRGERVYCARCGREISVTPAAAKLLEEAIIPSYRGSYKILYILDELVHCCDAPFIVFEREVKNFHPLNKKPILVTKTDVENFIFTTSVLGTTNETFGSYSAGLYSIGTDAAIEED